MFEPDVRQYFPNSEAMKKALRSLIPLMPKNVKKKLNKNAFIENLLLTLLMSR
jgi:hypothetical protein